MPVKLVSDQTFFLPFYPVQVPASRRAGYPPPHLGRGALTMQISGGREGDLLSLIGVAGIIRDVRIISSLVLNVADLTIANGIRDSLELYGLQVVRPEFRRPPGMRAVVTGSAINPAMPLCAPVQFSAGGIITAVALLTGRFRNPGGSRRIPHP